MASCIQRPASLDKTSLTPSPAALPPQFFFRIHKPLLHHRFLKRQISQDWTSPSSTPLSLLLSSSQIVITLSAHFDVAVAKTSAVSFINRPISQDEISNPRPCFLSNTDSISPPSRILYYYTMEFEVPPPPSLSSSHRHSPRREKRKGGGLWWDLYSIALFIWHSRARVTCTTLAVCD